MLDGENVNHPRNGIMMEYNTHRAWDGFRVSLLCDTSGPGQPVYHLVRFTHKLDGPILAHSMPVQPHPSADDLARSVIHFGSGNRHMDNLNNIRGIEVPHPEICKVHYALARILHASGAAEVLQKILRDETNPDQVAVVRTGLAADPDTEQEDGSSSNAQLFYLWRKLQTAANTTAA
jgi:hypothetical protein